MVTDNQVRILMKLIHQEKTLETAAAKAGISEKTARKYRKLGRLPSQCHLRDKFRRRIGCDSPQPALSFGLDLFGKTLCQQLQHSHHEQLNINKLLDGR